MKIGEFARKYGLPIRTVRYYVERALVTPERRNNQYIFNENCQEEMEKLLLYKSYHLSLQDIELLFFLEKTSNLKDETVLQIIAELLTEKKRELEEEREALLHVIGALDHEIKKYSAMAVEDAKGTADGVPLFFIPYLYCPACGTPLNLDGARISNNRIHGGTLTCGCGYQAEIRDGMILCEGHGEDTPFKVFNNVESVVSLVDEYSDSYRMVIDRAYTWMYHQMEAVGQNAYILAGPFTANFLLKHCGSLDPSVTLIIIDPSVKRLAKLRQYMEDFAFNKVFVAGAMGNLPLKKESVHLYIDDFSTINALYTYNQTPFSYVAPLLCRSAEVIGVINDYSTVPRTMRNLRELQPGFAPEKMKPAAIKNALAQQGVKIYEQKVIGETAGNGQHFRRHVPGEQFQVVGYRARK